MSDPNNFVSISSIKNHIYFSICYDNQVSWLWIWLQCCQSVVFFVKMTDIIRFVLLHCECWNSNLLRGKIQSRHISRKTYFVYILYENNTNGRTAIKHYCCNCMVGHRTVGWCAHIITIIWFLSWARYQKIINPPAEFLDHILITYESD